jgi:hypothetical protein
MCVCVCLCERKEENSADWPHGHLRLAVEDLLHRICVFVRSPKRKKERKKERQRNKKQQEATATAAAATLLLLN